MIVVLDNYDSYISPSSLQKCKDNGITLVSLPPPAKLQQLDGSVFGPLKTAYSIASTNFMTTNPGKTIDIYTSTPLLVGVAFPKVQLQLQIIFNSFKYY